MKLPLSILCLLLLAIPGTEAPEKGDQDKQQLEEELFTAARKGDLETLKRILTKHPEMKDVRNRGGWSLLHMAQTSKETVEYLIELGSDIEAKSGADWTPLHSQTYYGHKEGVALLLDHGADIDAKTTFGMTPLSQSIRWNRIEAIELLLKKGANVNTTSALGRTPLMISTIEGQEQLANLFLDSGADLRVQDGHYKMTALHWAALYGRLAIVTAIIKKGADLDARDAAGKTALDYANRYGHEKVARLLKASGASGQVDPAHFGLSPYVKKDLRDGEAYAWYMGDNGYAVKTKNHFLLFNYNARGGPLEEPRLANGRIYLDEISDLRVLVFAGSPHHSHHNPGLYKRWQDAHKSISFVYSFEDTPDRDLRYFENVEGPKYIHVPDGTTASVDGVKVESIPVSGFGARGSGFLVEADGVVIFHGGNHLLGDESMREAFRKPIDTLKERGLGIDLLILPGNFAWGRIFPINVEGTDHAVRTLKPRAFLASGGNSTEFLLMEVATALAKYDDRTTVFCPEHRGDLLFLRSSETTGTKRN